MNLRRCMGTAITLLVLLFWLLPVRVLAVEEQQAEERRVVRVAYPELSLDDQLLTGMELVQSGEADLIGGMLQNDTLQESFLYPERNYGAVYTTLEALSSNPEISATNYMKKDSLQIAVLETATTRNAELAAFLETANLTCEYIYCDTVEEQLKALQQQRADLLLNVSLTFLPNLKTVAQFAPRPYYFVTGLENESLIQELDAAIEEINLTDPYFEERLEDKYFQNTVADFILTESEEQYVQENNTLQVLVLPQYAPFAFLNDQNELCGISVAILDEIGKTSGITFQYHVISDEEEPAEEIASGNYSVVLGPAHSQAFAEENSLILSQAYMETSLTMFINKSGEKIPENERVLALMNGIGDPIAYEYREIRYYDTIEQCLEAVSRGEADYGYASRYLIEFCTAFIYYQSICAHDAG